MVRALYCSSRNFEALTRDVFAITDVQRIIGTLQDLLDEHIADPVQILRLLLSMILLQVDLRAILAHQTVLQLLFQNLVRALASPVTAPTMSRSTISMCLQQSQELNARDTGLVPSELTQMLEAFAQPVVQPSVTFAWPPTATEASTPAMLGGYSTPIPEPARGSARAGPY